MIVATLDTNVLLAGLRSRRGASFAVLEAMHQEGFVPALSVPLCLEYEAVLTRPEQLTAMGRTVDEVLDFLRHLTVLAHPVLGGGYRWRPMLPDANDDMVLECATASQSAYLVTLNVRDFRLAPHAFGFQVVTPAQFMNRLLR